MTNPHDKHARGVLSNPRWGKPFLGGFLPAAVMERLDWNHLRVHETSFVDAQLRGHESDILLTVPRKDVPIGIYILFEHQSTPQPLMAARVLRYVSRILEREELRKPRRRRLPYVYPVVLYHGRRKWTGPLRLSDLYDTALADVDPQGTGMGAELNYRLIDLSCYSDGDLRSKVVGHSAMPVLSALILKHSSTQDVIPLVRKWRDLLTRVYQEPCGLAALEMFMYYVLEVFPVEADDFSRVLAAETGPEVIDMAKPFAQRVREEGYQEGIEKGIEEGIEKGIEKGVEKGRLEALRRGVRRILERRFGALDATLVTRIDAADVDRLDVWFDRALIAGSPDEVFD